MVVLVVVVLVVVSAVVLEVRRRGWSWCRRRLKTHDALAISEPSISGVLGLLGDRKRSYDDIFGKKVLDLLSWFGPIRVFLLLWCSWTVGY